MESEEFIAGDSAGRFNFLAAQLKKRRRNPHNPRASAAPDAWSATDNRVARDLSADRQEIQPLTNPAEAGEFGQVYFSLLHRPLPGFQGCQNRQLNRRFTNQQYPTDIRPAVPRRFHTTVNPNRSNAQKKKAPETKFRKPFSYVAP